MLIASRSVMLSKSQQIPICSQTHSFAHVFIWGGTKQGNYFLEQNPWILTLNMSRSKQTNQHGFKCSEIPRNNSHSAGSG